MEEGRTGMEDAQDGDGGEEGRTGMEEGRTGMEDAQDGDGGGQDGDGGDGRRAGRGWRRAGRGWMRWGRAGRGWMRWEDAQDGDGGGQDGDGGGQDGDGGGRGVVLRNLLVGLTGFAGPLHVTLQICMFELWNVCSDCEVLFGVEVFNILILYNKTDIYLFAMPEYLI